MSRNAFDWNRLVASITDEASGIPADVVFQIVEDGQIHEVNAHKMILGIVSPMFKTMFYTTEVGDKTSTVIKIEKTTAPAFQIVKNAIYGTKSIEDSLKDKSFQEIFEVVNLIEQYQLSELAEAVMEFISNFPITEDSVLEVAGAALEFKSLFQKESDHLFLTCARFLKPRLKDADSIVKYAAKNNEQKEVLDALLALIKDIECPNCRYEDCQNGKPVKVDDFRVGLVVTNNKAYGAREYSPHPAEFNPWGWNNPRGYQDVVTDRGTGKVTSVQDSTVQVESIKPAVNHHTFRQSTVKQFEDGNYVKTSKIDKFPWSKSSDPDYKLHFLFVCK